MKNKGSNINTIKADNNSLVLNYIRRRPISRAELCKITGLSKSSVTTITKQLIEEGQLVEIGTESTSAGRRPILLDVVKNRRVAIGIFLSRTEVTVCIVNLKLERLASESRNIKEFDSPEQVLSWGLERANELLKELKIEPERCLGIGVAAPGPIDYKKGVILTPPNFELFHNFNVADYFKKICDLPVFLNNVPVLMAMYEHFKRETEIKNYMFVTVESGIGSAIMLNGNVFRGSAGFSGELGHTTVDVNGPVCSCGNRGCLEEYVTEKAIVKKYGVQSARELIDTALAGDEGAMQTVEEVAKYFASGLINAVNMFDLDAVVIYGELNHKHELLFSKLQRELECRCIVAKAHSVEIVPSKITDEDSKAFAASNVIDKYFRQSL